MSRTGDEFAPNAECRLTSREAVDQRGSKVAAPVAAVGPDRVKTQREGASSGSLVSDRGAS